MFVDFFIRRPIFATVCALLIVLAGAVCIPTLPISLYPELAPPQVIVTSDYIGANSKDVESAVTTILEQSINGVEGMRYMSSTSSNDGTSAITVTFDTGYDLDIAAVDVQNRVATVQGRLPAVVNNTGITITKANSNFVLAAGFISPDNSLSPSFISNYLDVYVKRRAQACSRRRRRSSSSASASTPCVSGSIPTASQPAALPLSTSPTRSPSRTSRSPPASSASSPPIPTSNFRWPSVSVGRLDRPETVRQHRHEKQSNRAAESSCSKTWAAPRSAPKTTTPA